MAGQMVHRVALPDISACEAFHQHGLGDFRRPGTHAQQQRRLAGTGQAGMFLMPACQNPQQRLAQGFASFL